MKASPANLSSINTCLLSQISDLGEDDLAPDFYESEAGRTKKRKASDAASSTENAERKKRTAAAAEPVLIDLDENAGINIPRRYSILPLIDDELL